jgi:hypothetical protein
MPLTVLVLAILVSIGGFIDFIVGDSGNRKLKERMADFYVAVGAGDWTLLYRYPASQLSRFMEHLFGSRAISVAYSGDADHSLRFDGDHHSE